MIGVVLSQSAGKLDEAALRAQLKEKLSSYEVPRRILDMAQDDMPTAVQR